MITDENEALEAPAGIYSEEEPDLDRIHALVAEIGEDALLPEEYEAYVNSMPAPVAEIGHYDNLAQYIDETDLNHMAYDIIQWTKMDELSREDWSKREARGIKLLGVSERTEGGANFEGASRVVHPLLAEAVNQFHARAITELWPAEGPVKTEVLGEPTLEVNEQAERVKDYMNYLYTSKMPGAFEEEDQMLFRLPLSGSCFKKIYYDPLEDSIVSRFVEPSQFIVPFTATNLQTAPRYTHRILMNQNDVAKLQFTGYYVKHNLAKPINESFEYPEIKQEIDYTEGKSTNLVYEDQRHTILECYIDLDIPGFEHRDESGKPTGIKLPYIVTVDRDNMRVLRVQRNWRPGDPKARKRLFFTHYKFTPGYGFYGYGLLHLIGGLSSSATGTLRAILDNAAFANMQGGFRTRDVRLKGGDMAIAPGEWREVDSSAEELAKAFFKIPYEQPSPVLFQLLGYLDERGQRFVGTTENMVGEANANAPVGTTLALIEQGSKQFTAIHMRLHLAHAQEFRITAELCAEYLPADGYPYAVKGGQNKIMAQDFDARIDIIPVSDPNIISSTQRIAQAQAILDLATKFPQKIKLSEAIDRMLVAMRVQNIDQLKIDDSQPDPMAQKMTELEVSLKEAQIAKLNAEAAATSSKEVLQKIEGLYSSLQAALGVVANPLVVPVADSIAKSAGFVDSDGGDIAQTAPVQQAQSFPGNQQTHPTMPPNPVNPELQQAETIQQPMPSNPDNGVMRGIEQPGNQIQARKKGGPIEKGKPYLVGEDGAELVIPSENAVVIPADQTRALIGIENSGIAPNPTQQDPDYDYAGYVTKYGVPDQSKGQHLTDEFKLPNHITFSSESKYNSGDRQGGKWMSGGSDRFVFIPSEFNLQQYSPEDYARYFSERERKGTFVQLPDGRLVEGSQ